MTETNAGYLIKVAISKYLERNPSDGAWATTGDIHYATVLNAEDAALLLTYVRLALPEAPQHRLPVAGTLDGEDSWDTPHALAPLTLASRPSYKKRVVSMRS